MSGSSAPADDYVASADKLAPLIAAEADEVERSRRLTPALLRALIDAGFFRLLVPRSRGGAELDPPTFAATMEAVAKHDGSTAWCLGQNNVCGLVAGSLPAETAREIFSDQGAILAWGAGPGGRAVETAGGYRVTGSWRFASGGRHATWFGAHCPVFEKDGAPRIDAAGAPVARTVLFPASAAKMTDIWHVIGLRGTASDSYAVTDLLVADAFTLIRDDPSERRESGPLYAMTTSTLFGSGFAAVALGLARSLLDSFVSLAFEKTPRGRPGPLRESAVTHAELARAEARLRGARMYLFGTIGEVWNEVQVANQLNLKQRMAIRLAATHTIHEAVRVGDEAYRAAGATAIFEQNGFERRFRDLHALSQQVQARSSHFETVGRHLLGLDADLQFV